MINLRFFAISLFCLHFFSLSIWAADESDVCGKLVSTVFTLDGEKNKFHLDKAYLLAQNFCDDGRFESNANFQIKLKNKKGKVVYQKLFYVSPVEIVEKVSKEKPTKFTETRVKKTSIPRLLKFALSPDMGQFHEYIIESYPGKKIYGKGKINFAKNMTGKK